MKKINKEDNKNTYLFLDMSAHHNLQKIEVKE